MNLKNKNRSLLIFNSNTIMCYNFFEFFWISPSVLRNGLIQSQVIDSDPAKIQDGTDPDPWHFIKFVFRILIDYSVVQVGSGSGGPLLLETKFWNCPLPHLQRKVSPRSCILVGISLWQKKLLSKWSSFPPSPSVGTYESAALWVGGENCWPSLTGNNLFFIVFSPPMTN